MVLPDPAMPNTIKHVGGLLEDGAVEDDEEAPDGGASAVAMIERIEVICAM